MNLTTLRYVFTNVNFSEDRVVDEFLVMRCQTGDRVALSALVAKWQPPFLRYASVMTRHTPGLSPVIIAKSNSRQSKLLLPGTNLIVMVLVTMAHAITEVLAQLIFLFTVKRIEEAGQ